ncbi:hypothetical protein OH77DRAFT_1439826 [Trametes cingulata]|nr:hypothetical protein OH77DRAFT_1439826 [Trametes cingulata]
MHAQWFCRRLLLKGVVSTIFLLASIEETLFATVAWYSLVQDQSDVVAWIGEVLSILSVSLPASSFIVSLIVVDIAEFDGRNSADPTLTQHDCHLVSRTLRSRASMLATSLGFAAALAAYIIAIVLFICSFLPRLNHGDDGSQSNLVIVPAGGCHLPQVELQLTVERTARKIDASHRAPYSVPNPRGYRHHVNASSASGDRLWELVIMIVVRDLFSKRTHDALMLQFYSQLLCFPGRTIAFVLAFISPGNSPPGSLHGFAIELAFFDSGTAAPEITNSRLEDATVKAIPADPPHPGNGASSVRRLMMLRATSAPQPNVPYKTSVPQRSGA